MCTQTFVGMIKLWNMSFVMWTWLRMSSAQDPFYIVKEEIQESVSFFPRNFESDPYTLSLFVRRVRLGD